MGEIRYKCSVSWCTASAQEDGGSCSLHPVGLFESRGASSPQPPPQPSDHPAVWDLVLADMNARDDMGKRKYGTRLKPHNGRDGLRDLYEELLDAVVYLRKEIYERDGR